MIRDAPIFTVSESSIMFMYTSIYRWCILLLLPLGLLCQGCQSRLHVLAAETPLQPCSSHTRQQPSETMVPSKRVRKGNREALATVRPQQAAVKLAKQNNKSQHTHYQENIAQLPYNELLSQFLAACAERQKLTEAQRELRETYECRLDALEQEKEMYQRNYESLLEQHNNLLVRVGKKQGKGLLYTIVCFDRVERGPSVTCHSSIRKEQTVLKKKWKAVLQHTYQQENLYQLSDAVLACQLRRERAELEKLAQKQELLEETYEYQLGALVQDKAMCQRDYEELLHEHATLRLSMPNIAFGKEAWAHYLLGDVGEEPQLPANIDMVLHSCCPFWPGHIVKDTHLLVLIPAQVNKQPFTLDLLGELVKCPHSKTWGTRFCNYASAVKTVLGQQSITYSFWLLVTRDVIPTTHYQLNADQSVSLAPHVCQAGYIEAGTLELATAVLSHHIHANEFLYPKSSLTYTRCREYVGLQTQVVVGAFSSAGLNLIDLETTENNYRGCNLGVACSRRL